MTLKKALLIFYSLFLGSSFFTYAQNDSAKTSINLYSTAFFDNKEFTNNIKKGYTLPGFFIQPTIEYKIQNFTLDAGFHMLYLASADSLERFVPVLRIDYQMTPSLSMIMGNIDSRNNHNLPEPIFKAERSFMNQPETGVQFRYLRQKFKSEIWINWEKYIKIGSPFQEQFTVGFTTGIKPNGFENKNGFYAKTLALATHQGGQIDSTDLPVTTIVNVGGTVGQIINLPIGNAQLGFQVSGYLSSDKSPSPHIKFKNGNAIYPELSLLWTSTKFSIGYWHANTFVNPRGEEIYGSVSTIDPIYDEKKRDLVTIALLYCNKLKNGFGISTGFNSYFDIKSGLFEYSYTFKMFFDSTVKQLK